MNNNFDEILFTFFILKILGEQAKPLVVDCSVDKIDISVDRNLLLEDFSDLRIKIDGFWDSSYCQSWESTTHNFYRASLGSCGFKRQVKNNWGYTMRRVLWKRSRAVERIQEKWCVLVILCYFSLNFYGQKTQKLTFVATILNPISKMLFPNLSRVVPQNLVIWSVKPRWTRVWIERQLVHRALTGKDIFRQELPFSGNLRF